MRIRFLAAVLAALAATVLAAPALAASPPATTPTPPAAPHAGDKGKWVGPPKKLPHVSLADRASNLDFLFGALKVAPDDETAKAIEQRIWALWMRSRSDTANLLMSRVQKAIEDKDLDLAITLLDAVVKIKPDYIEGWNRRATIFYMKKDYGRSIADIREVLRLEPRHFGALTGLGLILQDIGDDKQALEVYRRALAVYPRMQRIPDVVKKLSQEVEGRDI
jgi:tetratricopeptide (TPR) repeat protein